MIYSKGLNQIRSEVVKGFGLKMTAETMPLLVTTGVGVGVLAGVLSGVFYLISNGVTIGRFVYLINLSLIELMQKWNHRLCKGTAVVYTAICVS